MDFPALCPIKEENALIKYFPASRKTLASGIVLTLAAAAAVCVRRMGEPSYALVAVPLTIAVGALVTLFAARIAASRAEDAMMCALHIDLKPKEFIARCAPIFGAMPTAHARKCAYGLHLAEAHIAAGESAEASRIIDETSRAADALADEAKRSTVKAFLLRERVRCALHCGDAADGLAAELRRAAEELGARNPVASKALADDAELYSLWAALLSGKSADAGELEEKMKSAPSKLAKLDICAMLVLAADNSGDADASARYRAMLAEQGGETALARKLRVEGIAL